MKGRKIFLFVVKHCNSMSVYALFLSRQAVEGAVILPENQDFSQIGVKEPKLHFITAGSKGSLQ